MHLNSSTSLFCSCLILQVFFAPDQSVIQASSARASITGLLCTYRNLTILLQKPSLQPPNSTDLHSSPANKQVWWPHLHLPDLEAYSAMPNSSEILYTPLVLHTSHTFLYFYRPLLHLPGSTNFPHLPIFLQASSSPAWHYKLPTPSFISAGLLFYTSLVLQTSHTFLYFCRPPLHLPCSTNFPHLPIFLQASSTSALFY